MHKLVHITHKLSYLPRNMTEVEPWKNVIMKYAWDAMSKGEKESADIYNCENSV